MSARGRDHFRAPTLMWLVLCEPSDMVGLWAYRALGVAGCAPVHLISSKLLAHALLWEHRLERDAVFSRIRLVDGRTITSDAIRGVLNRLVGVPPQAFDGAAAVDRDYAIQEFTALLTSWLRGLPCPVVNRPTGYALCGAFLHDSQWALLGAQAGLPGATYTQTSIDPEAWTELPAASPPQATMQSVVVGARVFAAPAGPGIDEGCRHLAELVGCPVLGIEFSLDAEGRWRFVRASPLPDLTVGGLPLARALAELLGGAQ